MFPGKFLVTLFLVQIKESIAYFLKCHTRSNIEMKLITLQDNCMKVN